MSSVKSKTPSYHPLTEAVKERLRPYQDLMGSQPDGEIATLAGVDRRYIVIFRNELGIPAYDQARGIHREKPRARALPTKLRRSRLDNFKDLMGTLPDGELAARAGVSREAIMRYRQRHGIAACVTPRRDVPIVEPPVEVAPPVEAVEIPNLAEVVAQGPLELFPCAPPVGNAPLKGFVVAVDVNGKAQNLVVVASDLAEAAERSLRILPEVAPGAFILSIRYFGPALPQ